MRREGKGLLRPRSQEVSFLILFLPRKKAHPHCGALQLLIRRTESPGNVLCEVCLEPKGERVFSDGLIADGTQVAERKSWSV
jgi:hypothetical protein